MHRILHLFLPASLACFCACATTPAPEPLPGRLPLEPELAAFEAPREPSAARTDIAEPEGDVTLRDALSLALLHGPRLQSASWAVREAEARGLQAALLPNPELEVDLEEAFGSDERKRMEAAETTIRLSQLVELGGDRGGRRRLAAAETRLAGWDYEAERVAAGKVSPLEETKAAVEVANKRIELGGLRNEVGAARHRLAACWGSDRPHFARALGRLDGDPEGAPALDDLLALLDRNPEVARWADEMEERLAALALERARSVPDLTLGAGVQRFEETDDFALTFGFSIPLPVFDRNQGGVLEAEYGLRRAESDKRDAQARAAVALAESHAVMTAAGEEAAGLGADVVPAATKVLDALLEGYREGKFGYLDVLDAQRTLFEAKRRLLEAEARRERSTAIVESLIGTSLDSTLISSEKDG